jgi:hypothetical protein
MFFSKNVLTKRKKFDIMDDEHLGRAALSAVLRGGSGKVRSFGYLVASNNI